MIETPDQILAHFVTVAAATSFAAWRKRIKKPLTETAALRIAKTLQEIMSRGGDPSDALGMAEERGWISVKAEWYFGKQSNGSNGGQPDATSRKIALAAGFARSPGQDCF